MDNRENIFVEYDLNCSDEIKTIWALPSIFYFLFDILFIEDEKFTFFDFVIDYTKNKNIPRHLSTKNYEKINKSGLNIRNPSNKSSIIPVVKQDNEIPKLSQSLAISPNNSFILTFLQVKLVLNWSQVPISLVALFVKSSVRNTNVAFRVDREAIYIIIRN